MLQTATIVAFEWIAVAIMTLPLLIQARKIKRYQSLTGFSSETTLFCLFSSMLLLVWCEDNEPLRYFLTQSIASLVFCSILLYRIAAVRRTMRMPNTFWGFSSLWLYLGVFALIFCASLLAIFIFLGTQRAKQAIGSLSFAVDALLPLPQILTAIDQRSLFVYSLSWTIGRLAGHIILLCLLHIFKSYSEPVSLWQVLTYFSLIPDTLLIILAVKYGRGHRNEKVRRILEDDYYSFVTE